MQTLQELRKKPHHSYSSLSSYLSCSLKYFFRYILKLEAEHTSKNLLLGVAYHRTLDFIAGRRMENQGVEDSEIKELFLREWSNQVACSKNIDWEFPEEADYLRDKGLQMVETYVEQWERKTILSHAQAFSIEIPGMKLPVIGEFDLVEEDENGNAVIVDWKTAGKKWAEEKAAKDGQATLYCHAHKRLTGDEANFRFDVVTKAKEPAVQILRAVRTDEDSDRLIKVFQAVERGINAGVFIPNESSFFCGSCEFKNACENWGHCVKAA